MEGIVRDTAEQQAIQEVLKTQMASRGGELVGFEYRADKDELVVVATVRSVHPLDQIAVDATATALSGHLNRPVTLEVIVLPVTRSGRQ